MVGENKGRYFAEGVNTMTITITPPKKEDISGICDVLHVSWLATYPNPGIGITEQDIHERFKKFSDPEVVREITEDITSTVPHKKILVAKEHDKVVGYCKAYTHETHNELRMMYVLPAYQRKGIGTMFWEELQHFFDKTRPVILSVAVYNTRAIDFYKKLGFADTGKRFTNERHRMPISKVLIPEMEMRMEAEKNVN